MAFDVVQFQRDVAQLLLDEIQTGKRTFEESSEIVDYLTPLLKTVTSYESAVELMDSLQKDWEVDCNQLIGKYRGYSMEDTQSTVDTKEIEALKDKLRSIIQT